MQSRREKIMQVLEAATPNEITAIVLLLADMQQPNARSALIKLVALMSILAKALPDAEKPNLVLALREVSDEVEARYMAKRARLEFN
jgi:hypothetical protein